MVIGRELLEKTVCALEEGGECAAFSSGMAAAHAIFLTLLQPGDTVLIADNIYSGVTSMIRSSFSRWGIRSISADFSDVCAVRSVFEEEKGKIRFMWAEVISNPMLKVADIEVF